MFEGISDTFGTWIMARVRVILMQKITKSRKLFLM
jgi:hypothetical protein